MATTEPKAEKLVFYVKCRPRGLDLWNLACKYKRVFIGYPPWKKGLVELTEPDRSKWPATIQDISSPTFDYSAIRNPSWRRIITANRNLSKRIAPGSIVLVPRPRECVCYLGRVARQFEICSEDAYVSSALAYKTPDYESDLELWGDVAQTWPVVAWIPVPFSFLPGWTRYRVLSRNTAGIVDHPEALKTMEALLANPTTIPVDWLPTSDPTKVLQRMQYHLTPAAFEHLTVDLLQLEHPHEHWLHVGGSGDGGADGLGYDDAGAIAGAVQCKWQLPSVPIDRLPLAPRVYIATLSQQRPKRLKLDGDLLLGRDVARLLLKHAGRPPAAGSLGVQASR